MITAFIMLGVVNLVATVNAAGSCAGGLSIWAPAVNTLLLVVLGYLSRNQHRNTQARVDSAANASASAAAAAADSARITKELGGQLRRTELPTTLPPGER